MTEILMTLPKIIEYAPAFQEEVIALIDSALKELDVIPNTDTIIDDEDLFHIQEVYSGRGKFWIALEGDEVVGTVALRELDHNTAKLNRMFVKSKKHGSGIGQSLLHTALNFAKEQNFNIVILNTHHRMERAHRFYEKNGFVKVGDEGDKYSYQLILNNKV